MGHRTLFIASKTPKTKQEWKKILDSIDDNAIADAIADADYAELISDPDFLNELYLSGHFPCEYINYPDTSDSINAENFKAEISASARQKCREWKAKVCHDYADDLAKGKQFTENEYLVDSFTNGADFLFPNEDFCELQSQYSEELPNQFFICRSFFYDYHI